ncbi:MAG: type I glyceraldehyde-3-phosphate dehydrogenase [Deltaproteobacteria bacterium]|nr:type I glyceraldehyde-3-phosphate dehydrogenase [Deltaproteobacteria bacterium]
MATKIAINGFGRIGRCIARLIFDGKAPGLELVAINDLTDAKTLAHLLAHDSVHGGYGKKVSAEDGQLVIDGTSVPVSAVRDPAELPWKKLGVEVVLECTGAFRQRDKAAKHIEAGAKTVIISAPGKGDIDGTFCVGINTDGFDPAKHHIISNASCTTNCLSPMTKVLDDAFGIIKGHMITIHSYTNDQRILDLPHPDLRRARAAAESIIPTSTGAAKAIGLVLPQLAGKLEGMAIRVPTPNVSLTCLTAHVEKATTRDEVLDAMRAAAAGPLAGIFRIEDEPLVSRDFMGESCSSVLDAGLVQVVGGDLVELQAWYDNEWGFSCRMVDLARIAAGEAG